MKGAHMNPAESIQAHLDLSSARSIGIHFGTFQLTDESIEQPVIDLESEKKRRHIEPEEFLALKEGQPMLFSTRTRHYMIAKARSSNVRGIGLAIGSKGKWPRSIGSNLSQVDARLAAPQSIAVRC
jgi:hypothetical protein